jgi:hypothetical protein
MSQPPLRVELLGSFAIRVISYWIPALVFTLFEAGMPGFSGDSKIRRGRPAVGKQTFWVALSGLMNQAIATGIQGIVQFVYAKLLMHKEPVFNLSTTLPFP